MGGERLLFGLYLQWCSRTAAFDDFTPPSEETFGPDLRDQYTAELHYRLHLLPHLTITPDIQLVIHPALNPDEDQIWVFGLRARLDF